MIKTEKIREYAKLLLAVGINLQPHQDLIISAYTEVAYFVEILTEEAYKMGAKEVEVKFSNEKINRLKYDYAKQEVFETIPQFKVDQMMYYANRGCACIYISSDDPDIYKGVDINKLAAFNKADSKAMRPFQDMTMSDSIRWLVAAVPGKAWAEKLYGKAENNMDKLWEDILKCSYADGEDPIKAWEINSDKLVENSKKLNAYNFDRLHFKASNGTDITVGLAEDHIWIGGVSMAVDGIPFAANIPSEEIFTAPHNKKVNGRVVASMPLVYDGSIIDKFEITFKDGVVADYRAEVGQEVLKTIMETDEGAKSLGEIALVPFSSPIRQRGILFYNTLFDENAACHLALGAAYPTNIDQGKNPNKSAEEKGLNDSNTHVDFMFGTEDMECIGYKKDGVEVQVMKNGEILL